jgi:beta-glucosidase-like glycosyl hydrolase
VALSSMLLASLMLATMTPWQKAAAVVVTTERPRVFVGFAGVTFADQEGGLVKALPSAPPGRAARGYTSARQAFVAGRATARALHAERIEVDFAPVLDAADGPLGSREFRSPAIGLAFARGLGSAACVKHFPGLGSARYSTDSRPHVTARIRPQDLAPFRTAIRAGVRCVMVDNAFYGTRFRASLEPRTYRLLRSLGFRGVAITDSLSLVTDAPVGRWAPQAVRAGADLVLFTDPHHALRAIRALVPLARRGELDAHVLRVLRYRFALQR